MQPSLSLPCARTRLAAQAVNRSTLYLSRPARTAGVQLRGRPVAIRAQAEQQLQQASAAEEQEDKV